MQCLIHASSFTARGKFVIVTNTIMILHSCLYMYVVDSFKFTSNSFSRNVTFYWQQR